MKKEMIMLLLLSLATFPRIVDAELNAEPQHYFDQAPFLEGKAIIDLSWYVGNISDTQNFEKNLFENFALNLNRSGIPKENIPEIVNTVSSIKTNTNLINKDFNPDKDKLKVEISYNKLRLKELGSDIKVLTPTWQDVKEINLSSSMGRLMTNECGNHNDVKAI